MSGRLSKKQDFAYAGECNAHVSVSSAYINDFTCGDFIPWVAISQILELSFHWILVSICSLSVACRRRTLANAGHGTRKSACSFRVLPIELKHLGAMPSYERIGGAAECEGRCSEAGRCFRNRHEEFIQPMVKSVGTRLQQRGREFFEEGCSTY